MIISLIKKDKIKHLLLPNKYYGIYCVSDSNENGDEENIISVEAENNGWKFNSNQDVTLVNGNNEIETITIKEYTFYNYLDKKKNYRGVLYSEPTYDKSYVKYNVNNDIIKIGKTGICDIKVNNNAFDDVAASLELDNEGNYYIVENNSRVGVYLNENRILGKTKLSAGDIIFICGLKIIILFENKRPLLIVNNPNNMIELRRECLIPAKVENDNKEYDDIFDENAVLYKEEDYFHKRPRFQEQIDMMKLNIDPPPTKAAKQDMPLILIIGPMFTSGTISAIYAYITISNLMKSGSKFSQVWPSFLICIFSLMGSIGWPFIIRKYNNYKTKKQEKIRVQRYGEYITEITNKINESAKKQKSILLDNNPTLEVCKMAIEKKDSNLWNRKSDDDDFLNVNLGSGDIPMFIDLKVPEVHFSLDKDALLEDLVKFKDDLPLLVGVPIVYNFKNRKVTASIGNYSLNKAFADRIIFQLATLYSYDDVKIVVLSSERSDSEKMWEYIKILPHAWSNDKSIRFYGASKDEIREICYYLDGVLSQRLEEKNNKNETKIPHYIVITDNYKVLRNYDFIKKLLDTDENLGFSLFILNDKLFNLPADCDNFFNINNKTSEIFKNALNSTTQKFNVDFETNIDIYKYSKMLANIPIEINESNDGSLVEKIGFLELYGVGKIEQLNILNRWAESNPMQSLQALIGVGKGGEKIFLDLHEKFHGPHGLIAGMTGSGKSELIATYILSLAINYHPDEVQFILIDYKGGGLAGIFENKITGVKIPHLIGTITNLDTNEILRSLASLDSEIKRRQIIFGNVRDQLEGSVIDIYKYQQLYRDGVVQEPVSHLFIICDEFAELKQQQPEFLQQLISISRIGRSLGVHLILATQKPSGVVDNQIWSNSKFRICLRVQEKADSMEVIKNPDAAFLKNAGRFYLQIGYNEIFLLGQAAWAGGKYIPSEKIKKKIDNSILFINNSGYVTKKVNNEKQEENTINYGEEIKNIVCYINDLSIKENIKSNHLWLDKIPAYININELKRKYGYIKQPYELDIPIGEYDDPNRQLQGLLTIPFYKEGNVIVYGATGSGKENFITTMLYSSITNYMPSEAIFYVIDCGTGFLNVFNGIPQIGDVIPSDNFEKINNLFKMISYMMEQRKNLFVNYSGNYNIYCKNNENKIPAVVVIINNYDTYVELYNQFDDLLIQMTREGIKCGIYFVITVSNPSIVRSKLKQNFKWNYVLQQNNDNDYSNILGNVNKKYPSRIFGRGIVVLDNVYEFQTAMVSEKDKIYDYIERVKPILMEKCDILAIPVPVLPNIVKKEDVLSELNADGSAVIGIEKESLSIVKYDLKNNYTTLMLTNEMVLMPSFINPLIKQIVDMGYYDPLIINAEKLNLDKTNCTYYDNNFDKVFDNLANYIETLKYQMQQNENIINENDSKRKLCFIIGFSAFKNSLNAENSARLGSILEKGKNLGLINFVIVDSVDRFRMFSYESWYKTIIVENKGIFIGPGLLNQMTIKVSNNNRSLSAELPYNFCYVIDHGRAKIVKYLEKYDEN